MAKVVVLNFSGPLQSWAGPAVVKTRVDTKRSPSERAIKGLLGACFGVEREAPPLPIIDNATVIVTIEKPGRIVHDYQTISARPDEEEYRERIGRVLKKGAKAESYLWPGTTLQGIKYPGIVRRTYLSDAQFLVVVQGQNDEETLEIYGKILEPVWTPYLGKRAFSPTFPFVLGVFDEEGCLQAAREKLKEVDDFRVAL